MAGLMFSVVLILTSLLGMVFTHKQCCPMDTSFNNETYIDIRYRNVNIHSKTFDNCAGIKTLRITKSNIQQINFYAFNNLFELEELDLSDNSITYLFNPFENLTLLKRLYLHNNGLQPGKDSFTKLYILQDLIMSKNYITSLDESIFKNNGELSKLILTSNSIDYLPTGIFNNQTQLKTLHVDKNRLVEVQKELFSKLTMLRELKLDYNSISRLETGTFDNNTALRILNLSSNAIAMLPNGIFKNMEKLEIISLTHNQISSIGRNVFPENLRKVHLQYNQLKYLDASFLKLDNRLSTLDLNDNPWHCDCRLQAFFNVIKNKEFHKGVMCGKPKYLKPWTNLTSNDFKCDPKPDKVCKRDAKTFSYTVNASNIFCTDDNDGIFVTNGHRYMVKVDDRRLEFEYIDTVAMDSEPQCFEGVLIAVEAVLLVILSIVTYLLVKGLKQRANAISQNVSRRNTNIYTEPELPPSTGRSSSLPDYEEVENNLYGIELKTN